ncbi:MAG: acetyltransferase [Fretibacterium sp.]|nr:acetyltransferase [Fretibacterium sp.]
MHDLVIYGAGGVGREVAEIVRRINERHRIWNFLGFLDDNEPAGTERENGTVLGDLEVAVNFERPLDVVIAIARPKSKKQIYEALKPLPHIHFPHIIDRDVTLSSKVHLEEGVIISHLCSLSLSVTLGRCVFLYTGSNIGHDSVIGDFCSVLSNVNVSGNVTVNSETLIGSGASILQGLRVGKNSTVGIGAVVLDDVPDNCTFLGNPAQKLRQ